MIAALEYDVTLYEVQTPVHDGETSEGRKVQIKATFKDKLSFTVVPEFYLGLQLFEDGTHKEIFNGPGSVMEKQFSHRSGFGKKQLSLPLTRLQELSDGIPNDQRVLCCALLPCIISRRTRKRDFSASNLPTPYSQGGEG